MRISRLYIKDTPLQTGAKIILPPEQSHYLGRVLRAKVGQMVILFNGLTPHQYHAEISTIDKKSVTVSILNEEPIDNESPLSIHIGQGLCKGDKLELIIQKATELGVKCITPLITERCDVKLNQERLSKKHEHWQKIAESAAEQSGRVFPLVIHVPVKLEDWLSHKPENLLILNPHTSQKLSELSLQTPQVISLCIGPEGGFTESEITATQKHGGHSIQLGPRILRTETAPIAMSAILQSLYGDF